MGEDRVLVEIELPENVARLLEAIAKRSGRSIDDVVAAILSAYIRHVKNNMFINDLGE